MEEEKQKTYKVDGYVPGADFHLATGRTRASRDYQATSGFEVRKLANKDFEDILSIEEKK